jgi:hypothetical protein
MLRSSTIAVNWRKVARDRYDRGQGVCEGEEIYIILNLKYE